MNNTAIEVLTKRRTQYALGKNVTLSHAEIEALVKEAIRQAPSSFNSQSSRAVILFGTESEKLWNITRETLRAIVPAENFSATDAKLTAFAAGVGTILFFEDQNTIAKLQADYPLYADNFPTFSAHSAGMAQLAVWTALAQADIGASLQHYNPLIDAEVAKTWNLPLSWKMVAQMPFGSNEKGFSAKTFMDDAQRFKTFGA